MCEKCVSGGKKTSTAILSKMIMLEDVFYRYHFKGSELINVLRDVQEIYGYLDKTILEHVAERLDLPPSHVYGVATFYDLFRFEPQSEHIVSVCRGTACYVLESEEIINAVEREFGLKRGGKTKDGRLQLDITRCIGLCARGPIAIVDGKVISNANADKVIALIYPLIERDKILDDMKCKPYDEMNGCVEGQK